MRLEARKCLYDIEQATKLACPIHGWQRLRGVPRGAYAAPCGRTAVAIIGEALTQLIRVDAAAAGRITDARRIVGFRNILVHAYAQVDDRIVWDIVESKLPLLSREVDALVREQYGSDG